MSTLKERLRMAMQGPPAVTPAELARACKVKPPSVSDWLSGKTKRLTGLNLIRAAEKLGVSPEWLATGTGHMRKGVQPGEVAEQQNPYIEFSKRGQRICEKLHEMEQQGLANDDLYKLLELALRMAAKMPSPAAAG